MSIWRTRDGRERRSRSGRGQLRAWLWGWSGAAALAWVVGSAALPVPAAASSPTAPSLNAESAVLYAPQTGQVLYAKTDESRLMPASTTKVMTALLVLLHIHNLDRMVTITPAEAYVGGSSAPMRPGERLSVRDLLYGLLLVSGNNAAVALANATAGSVPRFVAMMNAEARALGATHTHFADPNGLPEPTHLTTALDLAKIAGAAIQQPEFVRILGTKVLEDYPMPNGPPQPMVNQDQLLWTYPGIIGGKIGYTEQAGNTMVAIARRHGLTLIAVVLHDVPWTLFSDESSLLTYGFDNYRVQTLAPAGLDVGSRAVRAVPGRRVALETLRPLTWIAPTARAVQLRTRLDAPPRLPAGRARGTVVGSLAVYARGALAGTVPVGLAAATPPDPPAPPSSWPDLLWRVGLGGAALLLAWRALVGLRAAAGGRRLVRRKVGRKRYRLRRDSVWMRMAGGDR